MRGGRRGRLAGPALSAVAAALALLAVEGLARVAFDPLAGRRIWWRDGVHVRRSSVPGLIYEPRPSPAGEPDPLGCRGPELSARPGADAYRIAVVGDSVAHGGMFRREEAFPGRLQALLNADPPVRARFEVANCAVSGYDVHQVAAFLEHKAPRLNAHRIVYAFYVNDFVDSRAFFVGDEVVAVAPDASDGLAVPRALAPAARWLDGRSLAWQWAKSVVASRRFGRGSRAATEIPLDALEARGRAGLREICRLAREGGVPLVLALVPPIPFADPDPTRCGGRTWHGDPGFCAHSDAVLEVAAGIAREEGIPVVDLRQAYRGLPLDALLLGGDDPDHPTTLGHEALAAALGRWLRADLTATAAP
ncbi:SGNH/GDSL hydrolase family protein [Myxococcota bacterium]|nr:SGNH/GDSL hydrolase family protein [Myxococcota bacterium]